jgi:N-methylhydantoinase B/oxoprolinase/acetone carboxylase alpha subunit
MAAAGFTGSATHVVQEALIIPPVKLFRAGELDCQIQNFILRNVRLPKQLWGDIQSQIASNVAAERRLQALIEQYGLPAVLAAMENAVEYSREHMRKMLRDIPTGRGEATDVLEDDGFSEDKRFEVRVEVKTGNGGIRVDCSGTSAQALGPINQSVATSKGAIYAAVLSLVAPQLPLNEAILESVDVHLPKGTLVNPDYPAPVSSYFHIMTRVAENVVRAMEPIRPDLVVAGSYGDAQNISGWGFRADTNEDFIWYLFQCGGTGGRAARDGNTGIRHLLSNARSESMEVWEKRYPLFFLAYEVVADSGGPGKFRGGLGQRRVFRLEADTFITANTDRHVVPPAGVLGGAPGTLNSLTVIRDGRQQTFKQMFGFASPSKFSNARLRKGDVLVCELGGGGGYGDPFTRDPAKVAWDVRNGWVSITRAKSDYRVCVDPETGTLHHEETAALRAELKRIAPDPR